MRYFLLALLFLGLSSFVGNYCYNGLSPVSNLYAEDDIVSDSMQLLMDPQAGKILNIGVIQKSDMGLIVFRLSKSFIGDIKVLNFPFRLMMELPMPYAWGADNESIKQNVPISVIKSFKYGNTQSDMFRVVAELAKPIEVLRSYVVERSPSVYDFIIEFRSSSTLPRDNILSKSVIFSKDPELFKAIENQRDNYVARNLAQQQENSRRVSSRIANYLDSVDYPKPIQNHLDRKIIIMLDPGHGGKDTGAISLNYSIVEKELVLDVSKRLKILLEQHPDITVILTRSGDYYLPLKDRILWAEYFGANLFVSIHADSSHGETSSSGVSVYTLSEVASDVQAQLLANEANRSDIVAGINLTSGDEAVNQILVSLSQRVRVNDSIVLARTIIDNAVREVRVLHNPIRSAGFAVLKVPSTPSVLIELGFLTNVTDIFGFTDEEYLQKLVSAIGEGILSYVDERDIQIK